MKTSSYGKYIHSQIRKEVKAEMKRGVRPITIRMSVTANTH